MYANKNYDPKSKQPKMKTVGMLMAHFLCDRSRPCFCSKIFKPCPKLQIERKQFGLYNSPPPPSPPPLLRVLIRLSSFDLCFLNHIIGEKTNYIGHYPAQNPINSAATAISNMVANYGINSC